MHRSPRFVHPSLIVLGAALVVAAGTSLAGRTALAQAPAVEREAADMPALSLAMPPAEATSLNRAPSTPILIPEEGIAPFVPRGLPVASPARPELLPDETQLRGADPDAIVGPDDRIEAPVTTYPYSAIGRIDAALGTKTWSCTGALVARGIMLTNRHCVFDEASQRLATFLSFTPGYRRGAAPFGVANGRMVYLSNIIQSTGVPLDYALVTLSDTIGDRAGWLGVKPLQTGWVPSPAWWTLAGYGFNWYGNRGLTTVQTYNPTPCRLQDLSENNWVVGHDCDMGSGNSGSPIFAWFDEGNGRLMPYAVAVNNAEWRLADKFSSCGAYRYGQCGNLGVQSNAFLPTLLRLLGGN